MTVQFVHKLVSPTSSNKTEVPYAEVAYSGVYKDIGKWIVTIPIIDKLTLLYDIEGESDRTAVKTLLLGLIDDPTYELYTNAPKAKTSRYKVNVSLEHPGSQQTILIQADPKKKASAQKPERFLRFEMNPHKLGPEGMSFFRERLFDFLVDQHTWKDIVANGKVTRLDIACDIVNIGIEYIAFKSEKAGKAHKYFGVSGAIETAYLAVKAGKSGTQTIYNKRQQLKDLEEEQKYAGLSHTRIETHVATQLPIAKLHKLTNPFQHYGINYMPSHAVGLPQHVWRHFQDCARYRGVEAALAIIPSDYCGPYKAALEDHQPALWSPNRLWARWPDAIKHSGLLNEAS